MIAGLIACESPIPTTVTVSPATYTLESLDQTVQIMAKVEDRNLSTVERHIAESV